MIKKLLSSSFFRFLENIITVVTSLLLTPFLISNLGNEDYGLWLLTLSVLGWFKIADLGFPAAVQRQIAWAMEKYDAKQVKKVFSTSVVLFICLGIFSIAGIIVLALNTQWLGVEKGNGELMSTALMLLCIKVLWDFFMNAFHGFFAYFLRYDIDANISSLNAVVKAILVYLLLPSFHIIGAVAATLLADFISNIIKLYYVKKLYPKLGFSVSSVSKKEVIVLFQYSKHVIASGVAKTIASKADPILVTKLFELALVPIYGIASRLTALMEGFALSVSGVFLPVLNKMAANKQDMADTFVKISSVNIFVYTTLYMLLLIFAELFIKLWVGKAFNSSVELLNILIFSFICRAVYQSIRDVLFAQANHKYLSLINLFGAVLNIVLSILFARYWGLKGIAFATAISFLLSDVILSLLLLKHYNKYNILPMIKHFIFSILLTYSLGLGGQYLIKFYVEFSWTSLVLLGGIITPLIVLLNGFIFLDASIRNKFIGMIKKKSIA